MKWFLHLTARYTFSFITACFLGICIGIAPGVVAGISTMLITSNHLNLASLPLIKTSGIAFLIGFTPGFLYGAYHGFKIGSYLYKRHVEGDRRWPEPRFFSGHPENVLRPDSEPQQNQQIKKSTETRRVLDQKQNNEVSYEKNYCPLFRKSAPKTTAITYTSSPRFDV